MNAALADRLPASTNALTTALSPPTPIPITEVPAAVDLTEVSATVDTAAPETKRPAPATIEAKRPTRAAGLTRLRRPTVDLLSPKPRPSQHWYPREARSLEFSP